MGETSQKKEEKLKTNLFSRVRLVSLRSSHLPFKKHYFGFREFKSPLYEHRPANRPDQMFLIFLGKIFFFQVILPKYFYLAIPIPYKRGARGL